jgi:superfamily II DNA or RNA helicase
LDKLELFDSIFVDEVHQVRSDSLIEILKYCPHMLYRIGCTGTLPDNRLDLLNIKSYLGPVTSYFPVKYLIENNFIADCTVKIFNIEYLNEIRGDYNQVKDEVFENKFRLNFISNKIINIKDNVLLLVGKIEKEGKLLENHLKSIPELKDRQIKFIYGKTKPKEREEWRQKCINENNIILIAVYPLFQMGINIKNLKHIFFASSNKAKIRTLQSIGRGLRKYQGQSATIYDIVDHSNKFLPKHALERQKFYEKENFNMEVIDIKEY